MRPRDWFSVGARLFGLWLAYRGLADLLNFGAAMIGIAPSAEIEHQFGATASMASNYQFWFAAWYIGFALYLIFGAEHLTRWAFRESKESTKKRDLKT
jgi:hypothetical protein